MYHRKFFTRNKRFSCSDRKTVNEQDPVVSIALLTVAQQYSGGCLINLACMPRPKVQNYFNEMFKNCYLQKTRAVEILHYTVCPGCDGIGIGILSDNKAHKILL